MMLPNRGKANVEDTSGQSGAQRMRWFQKGPDSGDISACDTFKGDYSSL